MCKGFFFRGQNSEPQEGPKSECRRLSPPPPLGNENLKSPQAGQKIHAKIQMASVIIIISCADIGWVLEICKSDQVLFQIACPIMWLAVHMRSEVFLFALVKIFSTPTKVIHAISLYGRILGFLQDNYRQGFGAHVPGKIFAFNRTSFSTLQLCFQPFPFGKAQMALGVMGLSKTTSDRRVLTGEMNASPLLEIFSAVTFSHVQSCKSNKPTRIFS